MAKRQFIIVDAEWGTLTIQPTEATCAGWSNMFPHEMPVLFPTRQAANACANLHWPGRELLIARHPNPAIQMHRTHTIDGIPVSFRRSIVGWVACFGEGRCVHFRQPLKGGVWVARRPLALETICTAPTLADAVRMIKARYEAHDREVAARIQKAIDG